MTKPKFKGQSEPAILQEFFDRWVSPRRNATIADLLRGKNAGEVRSETEPQGAEQRDLWRDLLPHVIALRSVDKTLRRGTGEAGPQWTPFEAKSDDSV